MGILGKSASCGPFGLGYKFSVRMPHGSDYALEYRDGECPAVRGTVKALRGTRPA